MLVSLLLMLGGQPDALTEDPSEVRFWRASAQIELNNYEEALEDFAIVAESSGGHQCLALHWVIILADCFDDFGRLMRPQSTCTGYDRDEIEGHLVMRRLRPLHRRRVPLQHFATKVVDAAQSLRTICPQPDNVYWALWQQARVYARYGQKQELDRVLCELARSFPERDAGWRASLWLADARVVCPSN